MQFATKASWFKPGDILWISYLADTDVFKTSSRRPKNITTSYDQTRRCQDVLGRLEDVLFMSSWRRPIYYVLKTSDLRRLENVWFKTSWRLPIYNVLKTSDLLRLEDVWFLMSWRRPIYVVLKTFNLWRLQDVYKTTSV